MFFAIMSIFMVSCTTPFSKFYHDETGGADITKMSTVIISKDEPKVFHGSEEKKDSLKMLENGYSLIGYSSFNAGNVDEDGAITQAKKIHASVVMLYSKYTGTVSSMLPLTLPNTQTSTTSLYGNAYGYGGYTAYSGTATTTTYGTKTIYIPYSVRRSDYFATYWVKLKPPIFGVYIKELTPEIKYLIGSNKGMLVYAVVKGSPAFEADILEGDIIRKIGDTYIYDKNSFRWAVAKYEGEKVNVIVLRDGKEITKSIKLRERSLP
jgi:hypothetical protein